MGRLRPRERESICSHLTKGEVEEMRRLLKELGDETLDQNFCEKLARKFNCATFRSGKPDIQWKQIQTWFQKKQQACASSNDKADSSPIVSEELVSISEDELVVTSEDEFVAPAKEEFVATAKQEIVASAPKDLIAVPNDSVSNIAPESSIILKGESLPEISDLLFEAKSSKDEAWYDVAYFLAHRVLSSGETEVHVRFVGFGAEEDEWVNVKRAVRERSIPLEPSECQRIQVGDLVLCFQDREDQAIYFDAHIMEIERRSHDIRGCRCLFLVYYDHDKTEEKVRLRRMCRRPSY